MVFGGWHKREYDIYAVKILMISYVCNVYYKKYNFRIHQPCSVFHFHKINAGQRRSSTHLCLVQKVQAAPRDIILSDQKNSIQVFWLEYYTVWSQKQ